jgi:DNA-binding NarL/FixJ family response regulator
MNGTAASGGLPVRVLILHSERLLREGLRTLLHGRANLDVIGDAESSERAALLVGEIGPDVVVIDLAGVRWLLRATRTPPPVVALGEDTDRPHVARVLQAGVRALASESDSSEEVAAAIRAAAAGQIYVTPRFSAPGLPFAAAAPQPSDSLHDLTAREREIFAMVIVGLSTAMIARQLDVSPRTVETHRAHLSRKLGARSAADLVRFAARHSLLPS